MLRWLFSFQLGWKNELGSGVALAASQFSHEPAVRPQAPCPPAAMPGKGGLPF